VNAGADAADGDTDPPPCITLVRFPAPGPALEPAALRELLERTAPRYRAVPGLRRKLFLSGEGTGGGLYEWRSRADAERWFTPQWRAQMRAGYGVEPTLEWFEAPCTVDNRDGTIHLSVGAS